MIRLLMNKHAKELAIDSKPNSWLDDERIMVRHFAFEEDMVEVVQKWAIKMLSQGISPVIWIPIQQRRLIRIKRIKSSIVSVYGQKYRMLPHDATELKLGSKLWKSYPWLGWAMQSKSQDNTTLF